MTRSPMNPKPTGQTDSSTVLLMRKERGQGVAKGSKAGATSFAKLNGRVRYALLGPEALEVPMVPTTPSRLSIHAMSPSLEPMFTPFDVEHSKQRSLRLQSPNVTPARRFHPSPLVEIPRVRCNPAPVTAVLLAGNGEQSRVARSGTRDYALSSEGGNPWKEAEEGETWEKEDERERVWEEIEDNQMVLQSRVNLGMGNSGLLGRSLLNVDEGEHLIAERKSRREDFCGNIDAISELRLDDQTVRSEPRHEIRSDRSERWGRKSEVSASGSLHHRFDAQSESSRSGLSDSHSEMNTEVPWELRSESWSEGQLENHLGRSGPRLGNFVEKPLDVRIGSSRSRGGTDGGWDVDSADGLDETKEGRLKYPGTPKSESWLWGRLEKPSLVFEPLSEPRPGTQFRRKNGVGKGSPQVVDSIRNEFRTDGQFVAAAALAVLDAIGGGSDGDGNDETEKAATDAKEKNVNDDNEQTVDAKPVADATCKEEVKSPEKSSNQSVAVDKAGRQGVSSHEEPHPAEKLGARRKLNLLDVNRLQDSNGCSLTGATSARSAQFNPAKSCGGKFPPESSEGMENDVAKEKCNRLPDKAISEQERQQISVGRDEVMAAESTEERLAAANREQQGQDTTDDGVAEEWDADDAGSLDGAEEKPDVDIVPAFESHGVIHYARSVSLGAASTRAYIPSKHAGMDWVTSSAGDAVENARESGCPTGFQSRTRSSAVCPVPHSNEFDGPDNSLSNSDLQQNQMTEPTATQELLSDPSEVKISEINTYNCSGTNGAVEGWMDPPRVDSSNGLQHEAPVDKAAVGNHTTSPASVMLTSRVAGGLCGSKVEDFLKSLFFSLPFERSSSSLATSGASPSPSPSESPIPPLVRAVSHDVARHLSPEVDQSLQSGLYRSQSVPAEWISSQHTRCGPGFSNSSALPQRSSRVRSSTENVILDGSNCTWFDETKLVSATLSCTNTGDNHPVVLGDSQPSAISRLSSSSSGDYSSQGDASATTMQLNAETTISSSMCSSPSREHEPKINGCSTSNQTAGAVNATLKEEFVEGPAQQSRVESTTTVPATPPPPPELLPLPRSQGGMSLPQPPAAVLQKRCAGSGVGIAGGVRLLPVTDVKLKVVSRSISASREAMLEELVQHNRSMLRRVASVASSAPSRTQSERDSLLEQIRAQAFSLRQTPVRERKPVKQEVDINVAAILEKANAIRQALAGSDEDEDGSVSWDD